MILWILFTLLHTSTAFMDIGSSNVALSDSVNFDAAVNAWTISFTDIPKYTAIIPQICHASSFDACPRLTHSSIVDCQSLYDEIHGPNFLTSEELAFDDDNCPILTDRTMNMGVRNLLYATHPPALRIQNNNTLLDTYSSSVSNTSYGLLIRVLFIQVHDMNLYELHQTQKQVSLKTIDQSGGVFSVKHECRARGLVAPRKAILTTVIDAFGSRVCVWQCQLSHIRQPFNSLPPLAIHANRTDKVCQPLPNSFTAVKFEFNIYMQVSSNGVPILTQSFYDDLNQLADLMQIEARPYFGDCIVVLTIEGAIFGKMSIEEILLAHTIHQKIFSNYETIHLISPSRRLLAGYVINGNVWFAVQGVIIIPRTNLFNIPDLHEKITELTRFSLGQFVFDDSLQVQGVDQKVVVKSLHRSLDAQSIQDTNTVVQSHDILFYIVISVCVLLVIGKTYLMKSRRRCK